jgi:hypothetical protein
MNIETQKIQDLVQSSSEYYDEEFDEDLANTLLEKLKIESNGSILPNSLR